MILELEKEYILKFTNDKNYKCVNKKSSKEKYKNIKIRESNYEKAINLLKNNDLLD